jgi:hypothetical protein
VAGMQLLAWVCPCVVDTVGCADKFSSEQPLCDDASMHCSIDAHSEGQMASGIRGCAHMVVFRTRCPVRPTQYVLDQLYAQSRPSIARKSRDLQVRPGAHQ